MRSASRCSVRPTRDHVSLSTEALGLVYHWCKRFFLLLPGYKIVCRLQVMETPGLWCRMMCAACLRTAQFVKSSRLPRNIFTVTRARAALESPGKRLRNCSKHQRATLSLSLIRTYIDRRTGWRKVTAWTSACEHISRLRRGQVVLTTKLTIVLPPLC